MSSPEKKVKIECECGSVVNKCKLSTHKKSKKHKKYMNDKEHKRMMTDLHEMDEYLKRA